MRTLLAGIPLDQMNTSMTINATAAWLLSLYVAFADEQGASRDKLTGTGAPIAVPRFAAVPDTTD
jgi:(2R)-ethylmalonyl-CoA mutase